MPLRLIVVLVFAVPFLVYVIVRDIRRHGKRSILSRFQSAPEHHDSSHHDSGGHDSGGGHH